MVIYCDLDGVLTNFDKSFENVFGVPPEIGFKQYSKEEIWDAINSTTNFWKDMAWQPGGKELWGFIKDKNTKLLTTPAHSVLSCEDDKSDWCKEELGEEYQVIFSSSKEDYATEDSVLIDDSKDNIEKFKNAGGHTILHTSAEDSIKKLSHLLSKYADYLPATAPIITDDMITKLEYEFKDNSTVMGGEADYLLCYTTVSKELIQSLLQGISQTFEIEATPENVTQLFETLFPDIPYFEISVQPNMGVVIVNYVTKDTYNEMASKR